MRTKRNLKTILIIVAFFAFNLSAQVCPYPITNNLTCDALVAYEVHDINCVVKCNGSILVPAGSTVWLGTTGGPGCCPSPIGDIILNIAEIDNLPAGNNWAIASGNCGGGGPTNTIFPDPAAACPGTTTMSWTFTGASIP